MGIRGGGGKFRHLLTVQRQTGARDTVGNETDTWNPLAVTWGWIEPYVGSARAGKEEFMGKQLIGITYTRVHLRGDSRLATLSPKDRIVYGRRIFDVSSGSNHDDRNYETGLMARE